MKPSLFLFILLLIGCSSEVENSWHFQQTHSLADTGEKLCVIGDSGTGNKNQYAVSKAMESAGCDQIRVLGDIIYPAGIEDENDPGLKTFFLEPYDAFLKQKVPFYLILGNHDYKKNRSIGASWVKIANDYSNLFFPNNYYSESWKDICFFSIETTWYDKAYFIHKRNGQTNWLQRAMEVQKDSCKFSVIFGHHPLFSSGAHGDSTWQQSLFLEDEVFGKVDLYISGHEHHISDEGELNGTRQLISGSAGQLYAENIVPVNAYYVERKFGFLTLEFLRHEHSVSAKYEFVSVDIDKSGKITEINIPWSNTVKGQGIR